MESSTEKRAHIVILPFAQQGHINPLLQLARKLAERGARVTFVLSENTLPSDKPKIPNLQFLGVADNLPAERSRGSRLKDSIDSMVNMEAGFRDLLQCLCDHPAGVSALIYDAFMHWAPSIASSLSLHSICFYTTNATTCALSYQFLSLEQRGIIPFGRDGDKDGMSQKDVITGIDGLPELLPEEFPAMETYDASDFRYKFMMRIVETLLGATAVILNTMEELEPRAVAALRAQRHIYTVGPLLLLLSGRPSRLDVNYWQVEDNCLPWLDSRPPSSVLYVSFGSVASFPLPHFQQLALGLEASDQPFLWVVRPDSIDVPLKLALPEGFLDRTKNRGLIVSWGPQLLILSHPSIGGFFTHGGWNSIIENLSLGSVPMICWPNDAEQPLNRRLMMQDHWNIGLRLQHEGDGSVPKEEIARVVHDLLKGEHGKDLKKSCIELGNMAKKAVVNGGSSYNNFEALYNHLALVKNISL